MFKVIAHGTVEFQEFIDQSNRFNAGIEAVRKCLAEGDRVIIKSNQEVLPLPDTKLETMQGVVGGLIEVVGCVLFPEMAVVINDEGRVRGLPYNQIASIASGFQIFGDAILLPEDVVR